MLNYNKIQNIIVNKILECANDLNVTLDTKFLDNPSILFSELIEETYKKYIKRVVILIDDWDKPIRDNLLNKNIKEINRLLSGIYITTKGNDAFIKFAFATGEFPIRDDMLFGFNNFTDISLDEKYGNVCGFTEKEVNSTFNIKNSELDYYNGYYFLKDRIYNPFDILQFLAKGKKFDNYWFESGTPTYLLKLIQNNNYFLPRLSNITVGKEIVSSFDIENINIEVILYQAGYLTIDEVKEKRRGGFEYKLKLPNQEVKISLNEYLIEFLLKSNNKEKQEDELYDALADGKLEFLRDTLQRIFASIPYNNYTNNNIQIYEGFYASIIYVYLQALGIEIIGEDVTNQGRIDLTCFIEDKIYIIEFKVTDEDPLKQIKEKKYYQKYINNSQLSTLNPQIFLVGINFDKNEKNIKNFVWEKL
jgi:hypothetical protein